MGRDGETVADDGHCPVGGGGCYASQESGPFVGSAQGSHQSALAQCVSDQHEAGKHHDG